MAKRNAAEEAFHQRKQDARVRRRWTHGVPILPWHEECPDCGGTQARFKCTTCGGRGHVDRGESGT